MADVFDQMMASTCSILKKARFDDPGADAYGQPAQSFSTAIASWPCRVSKTGTGKEARAGKKAGTNEFLVFMRPPTQDDAHAAFSLTIHNWLKVGAEFYNVLAVDDPSKIGHHLEVKVEQVLP